MTALTAPRRTVPRDPSAFTAWADQQGWGDGLPLIPPTEDLVASFVEASGLAPDTVVAKLPPLNAACTVELIAVNAVLAGAPAAAMPLLVSAVAAAAEPEFELQALNATTASVVPAMIVNGPVRHELGIGFGASCLGGAGGGAPSIGRAFRLVMRNVAGQRAGVTSQSVFGQPGRNVGIVFGEWEERSPWAPLAEQRGVAGDAVTLFGTMGTMNIVDVVGDSADLLIDTIGRSMAYPGANGFAAGFKFSEAVVGLNPVWAEMIAAAYPDIEEVRRRIWDAASLPVDTWPEKYHKPFARTGRIDDAGRVHLLASSPERLLIVVAGGLASLHGLGLHGFGTTLSQTKPIRVGLAPSPS